MPRGRFSVGPRRVRPVRIDVAGIVAMTVAVAAIVLVASGAASPTLGVRRQRSRSAAFADGRVVFPPLNEGTTRLSRWRCFGIGPSQRRRSPVW